jgi:hypothetical protein
MADMSMMFETMVEARSALARRRFRAGGAYDLVAFERLPPEEQAAVIELRGDPRMYGLFKPRDEGGRTVKAVSKEVALLWFTLQTPGALPVLLLGAEPGSEPDAALESITQLLLDDIIEIEDRGEFLSGARAAALLVGAPDEAGASRLARLSHDALRYGEALELSDPQLLATRLYCFGREPVSAENERRFAVDEDLLAFLGAGSASGPSGASGGSSLRGASAGAAARRLAQTWRRVDKPELAGWIAWTRTDDRGRRVKAGSPTFKMYVSPRLEAMPAAFAETVDVLSDSDGAHFKVGRHAGGLLRPDKLVAYFAELDDLLAAATRLGERLRGLTPHGVPFSAEIALDGLLSWGMDPPAEDRTVSWQPAESWRLWVARRLAAAMIAAQRDPSPELPPWRFALARVRCDGVDVDRWTPSTSMWARG